MVELTSLEQRLAIVSGDESGGEMRGKFSIKPSAHVLWKWFALPTELRNRVSLLCSVDAFQHPTARLLFEHAWMHLLPAVFGFYFL